MPIGETIVGGFIKGIFNIIARILAPLIAFRKGRRTGRAEARAEQTEADLEAMKVRKKHEDAFAKRSDDENKAAVSTWAKKS